MNYLENIKETKLKFFDYAIGDILRAIDGSSLIGAFILCFCVIDYLSYIARLKDSDYGDNYKAFIESKYFDKYDGDKMYAIRCSLIHTYGLAKAMKKANLKGYRFKHKNPENHKKFEGGIYWLNLGDLLSDIIKATYNFFSDLEMKSENDLLRYAKRINILSVYTSEGMITYQKKYSDIHRTISILDSDKIDWDILKTNIYQLCNSKP